MRATFIYFSLILSQYASSQELDIFQNNSIYANNRISIRTMYSLRGNVKQKELVTHYNTKGQKIKQYWFWNGDKQFHNVETFYYSPAGMLTSMIDSFADGNVERINFTYEANVLRWRTTFGPQNDTCDHRFYPDNKTVVHRWYADGEPYRIDTTTMERENVKLDYRGYDYSDKRRWHYKFLNQFDSNGNLTRVSSGVASAYSASTVYFYDSRNLLQKKEEIFYNNGKRIIQAAYLFEYR